MRTIFVGNVAAEVVKSKVRAYVPRLCYRYSHFRFILQPLLKNFKKHILSYTPSAQIESVRFRSVAFQKPVTKLPGNGDEPQLSKTTNKTTDKEPRQHDVDRISSWRDSKGSEAGTVEAEKRYLTPQEKKRVAFIKHDFHQGMDVVNAYVVFAHPQPSESRAPNVPAIPPVLDPYEAAQLAVNNCDGSVFHERTIRVDAIHENDKSRSSGGDPKLSVFVGNLDFASKEEDLRVFFEGIVAAERGPAPQRQDESDDVSDKKAVKSPRWVTRVRIIRDKDTQVGKGFAYIQFAVSLEQYLSVISY
jgi:nucleolar protein 12